MTTTAEHIGIGWVPGSDPEPTQHRWAVAEIRDLAGRLLHRDAPSCLGCCQPWTDGASDHGCPGRPGS